MSARIINGRGIRLERAYIWLPSGISMRTWRPTTIQRKKNPIYVSKMANNPTLKCNIWESRALFLRNPQKTCIFPFFETIKKKGRSSAVHPTHHSLSWGLFSFYLWKKGSLYGIIQMSGNGPGSVPPTYFRRFPGKDDPFVFLLNGIWNALAVLPSLCNSKAFFVRVSFVEENIWHFISIDVMVCATRNEAIKNRTVCSCSEHHVK